MQVEINEHVPEDATALCSNHGTRMNCPTRECPGVALANPDAATVEVGFAANRAHYLAERARLDGAFADQCAAMGLDTRGNKLKR